MLAGLRQLLIPGEKFPGVGVVLKRSGLMFLLLGVVCYIFQSFWTVSLEDFALEMRESLADIESGSSIHDARLVFGSLYLRYAMYNEICMIVSALLSPMFCIKIKRSRFV